MRTHLRVLVASAILFFFISHATKLIASPPSVPAGACLYALDPTAADAFQIAGAQSVYTACGVVAESSSSSAFEMEGAETLYLENHAQVSVVGGADLTGQTYLYDTINGKDVSAVKTSNPGDPLSSLSPPTSGTLVGKTPTYYDMNSKPANNTLSPGIYCGGLTIGNTNGATFTFSPGVYIMAGGGVTLESEAQVRGTGVTFYITSSTGWGCSSSYSYKPITISGQVNATLSAPTSGALDGILFFGNRTGCSTVGSCVDQINGGSTAILNGALYFKSDEIEISGANTSGYTMLVADKIYINGNSNFAQNGSPFDDITVSVSPSTASLYASQTQQFTATVNNTGNTAVTWTISPSSAGSINSSGLYTAPSSIASQQTVTITATSQADTAKSASATIVLQPPPPAIAVSVTPATATLYANGTQQFTATVANTGNQAVTWTLSPAGVGAISAAGVYTAPATIASQQTVTITATSQASTSASATATVTLMPAIAVSVSPATAALYANGTQQFTATVANTGNQAVTWTLSPAGVGTISAAGVYTAPATIASQQTVTVTATSQASSTASATATVTLMPAIAVSVTPATAALYANGTQQFTATVANTGNQAVTWTLSPAGVGAISAAGVYTAPATIASQQTVTVTATSQASTSASATATVTLMPAIAVSVTPATAALYANGTQQFTATVANTGNQAVTWTLSPAGVGAISASGVYTAPATIGSQQTVTVTATSQASSTASATATVTLMPAIAVSVTPATAALYANGTQQFTATVANTGNQAVTWTLSPAGVGAISAAGVYTAPATIGSQQTVTVTATSQASSTASATATVTLMPAIAVSVTPATAALYANGTQQFTATVANTGNQAVTWTLSPAGVGAISASGVYTAPATIGSQQTVTVTATSQADTAKSASATIVLQPPPPAIAVSVTPATAALYANGTQQFTATVANTGNQAVTWTLSPAGVGAISAAGVYTAPATIGSQQTVTVTATSQASSTASATATVTLMPAIAVSVTPATAALYANGTQQFTATVANTGNQAVTWTLSPAGVGAISASGVYTAPATIGSQQTVTVTATSQASSTASATATVTLMPAIAVSVTPATAALYANGTQQFTATVSNTGNQAVTWTLSPAGVGAISASGVYTAPATIGSQQTVTVTATSQASSTASATATVTLMPAIAVSVTPATAALYANGTQQFTATVANTGNQAVTWTLSPAGVGAISAAGVYTAPATIASQQTVTVTATSQASTSASATATVTLMPAIAVSVTPATAALYANGTQQFTATVANTGNQAVTWTLSPAGVGAISASGVYTAPATIGSQQTVTVTATSQADTAKSASATIVLQPPPPAIAVSVTPATAALYANGTQQFTATVANTGNQAVTWTLSPAGVGAISAAGVYTAPATIASQQTVTVTATSQASTSASATATVTLMPAIAVSVTPATAALYANGTQQFTATVANTGNQAVTWTLSPAGVGAISASGVYTAPATIGSQQTVTVTATSQASSTASATATVTLMPAIAVSVTPATAALYANGTQQFTATVSNTGNQAVTWTLSPAGVGAISASGVYTAPATIGSQQTVTVTATSQASSTASATATVTLMPAIAVSVTPATAALYANGTQQFTATVANTGNQAVTWTLSPAGVGAISAAGVYTAPATIASQQTVTVTATSQASTSASATATVTLMPAIAVSVTPATAALYANGTQQFTATVANTGNQAVTWTLSPAGVGAISASGVYTAPATIGSQQTVTVTATSQADTAKSASATIVLQPPPPAIAVSVTPATAALYANGTQQFTATVANTGNQAVTWTLSPAGVGAISAAGVYTAPATIASQQTVTVTATSQASTSASATATVTLMPAIAVSVTPATAALYANGTQQFTATVANTGNQAVTWTLSPAGVGAISASGVYTAPATIGSQQTVTVTATSQADTAKSASATIVLQPPPPAIAVSVTPATAALYANGTQQFTATVANTGNQAVTWTLSPAGVGAISAAGVYTAPATIGSQQTVTVTATSQASSTASATATVTLMPAIAVSVTPATAALYANGTQQFTATVANTGNQAVTWTLSPAGVGAISASGVYTAPATIGSQQTVTVTATSQASSTASATATVTLMPAFTQCNTNGYTYARAITIDHTKVPNTDQANFPFLFDTTDPLLATTANGGHVSNPNGYDIIFTSDPAGQNPLPYEMEEYNPATGQVAAWIEIPDLSHTSDTTIYLFYGNPNITSSQQNQTAVWDSNYMGVWHLGNGSALSLNDSTANANNATDNGAVVASGPFAGGMQTNGSTYATIGTPSTLADLAQGPATFSAWVNSAAGSGGILMGKDDGNGNKGWALSLNGNHNVDFVVVYNGGDFRLHSNGATGNSTWSYVTVTLNGNANQNGSATVYINGVPDISGSGGSGGTADDSAQVAYLANATFGDQESVPFSGTTAEFRISRTIRSADWIATEYANQSSPSTFFNLSTENIAIGPTLATLYESQTQQFTPIGLSACQSGITWSISPTGVGTITQNGIYTAPATITTQQTVIITAADQANPAISASATVTLVPPVAVSVTPATVTIATNGGDQQQFTASVINSSNTAVTWSVSPSGAGTIDQTGLYTAPELITSQQTVTVTATSQFDPSKSASAVITLIPPSLSPACGSNGYSFVRAIAIDHTKIPNTDQINFPFLFNTTDPLLATTSNGGHVANFNGYDIMFTSDPAGQNPLPYEMEEYNPATGQVIAWVQIPVLPHTSDTVIYLFYGNPNITTSQQNPTAVWDSNYLGVWHLATNNGSVSAIDSTANGNNGTLVGALPTSGEIDGALNNPHSTSGYIDLSSTPLASATPAAFTLEAWVNIAGLGSYPAIVDFDAMNSNNWGLYVEGGGAVGEVVANDMPWAITSGSIPAGWNHLIATSSANGPMMYLNGVPAGQAWSDSSYDNGVSSATIGLGYGNQLFNGSIDEVRVSNIVRSPDWIATEYANQSSPSTFYQLNSENFVGVVPTTIALYASESEQFTALNGCGTAAASWSIPAGSPGTLTTGGLYTAPASIASQQTVTITATSQADGSTIGTSAVTLLPAMSISPAAPTLYASNETLQFTAALGSATNVPVIWSIAPANTGSISQTGLYTAPGFNTQQMVTITATSVQNPAQSTSTTLTLLPVLVTPYNVTMYGGFSQQFTANVPVVWALGQGAAGTITQTGLYTAPINGAGAFFSLTATAQADPNGTFNTWISLSNPVVTPVTPAVVSLYGGQSQSFNACLAASAYAYGCSGNSNGPIWSISPAGAGTISSSGAYTAPPLIPTQQTVIVTATSPGNPAITSSGTITLLPPVVNVKPQSATLYADQTEQFTAVVTNSSNTAVSWSISPAGMGSISSAGVYTAPPYLASQETVTITASLQAIPAITGSAVITLSPAQCPSQAYSYVRPIVIDHTKVLDADQPNFPFYFAATDPLLASTSNSGHVTSSLGNDIVFTSDPAGLHPLPFDLEQYNPATGQIVAWIKVPVLSHSQDTVIYLFYGNPNITAPQQNPTAVWDTNYTAVYQFEDMQNGSLLDSTINGNNASPNNVQETQGQPGAAGAFDGQTSYVTLPTNDFPSYPTSNSNAAIFNASFGVWFKTATTGVILGQSGTTTPGNGPNGWVPALYIDTNGYLRANFFYFQNNQQIVSSTVLNDNNWHYAVLTFVTDETTNTIGIGGGVSSTVSGIETVYVDGQVIGQLSGLVPDGYTSAYSYFLGTGDASSWAATPSNNNGWFFFNGSLDEAEISSIARSSGWVQAEYNNQSSPSTFFALGAEAGAIPSINPSAVTLNQSASQQFTVLQTGLCTAGDAVWSMPAGSPGTLSPTGLYTAPASIDTQQTVTVTATTLGANSTSLNATVTLMPPVSISITPGVASLPNGGTQQFIATVANTTNTAVTWTLNPVGVGSISSSGLYTAPATLNGQQTVRVIVTSQADPTQWASATVTLGVASPLAPTITVNPPSATLYAGQTQQFAASLTNLASPSVTWSLNPSGVGSIDANGNYTAPASINSEQTVTITATSQADSALTASVSVLLVPSCTSNGYTYVRAITIHHNLVRNSDQANFPFLFITTDPLLASTANGGHVLSANGYDMIFTSDAAGQHPLPYEMEEYTPATGQVIAWVQIPDLSHTSDTVIYLFYSNPNITTSQQNPTAVWDSNYLEVLHMNGDTGTEVFDSTANGNSGTKESATSPAAATAGIIANSDTFDGSTSYVALPPSLTAGLPIFSASLWVQTTDNVSNGTYWNMPSFFGDSTGGGASGDFGVTESGGDLGMWSGLNSGGDNSLLTSDLVNDGNWHRLDAVNNGSTISLYLDGTNTGQTLAAGQGLDTYGWYVGAQHYQGGGANYYVQGDLEEFHFSKIARSADWIATEYANQSSPSNFYSVAAEGTLGVLPSAVTLYPYQSQQFAAPGICGDGVSWSLSAGVPGTLTSTGLYTAPASIAEQQVVTVTATSQANPDQSASATVTLMPPVSVTISPASVTLNQNQTQQFTATVSNSANTAVTWTMSPEGFGSLDQNGGYITPSSIATQQTVTITATSVTDPTKSASAMVTLSPSVCASTGYGYQRVIVIDHTKVPNTDQINYPFLFNSTDPDLATLDNGGHVANANGYDIIFSSDPNGNTKLDFEIEQYNPVTGQLVVWIRIPTLSHSSDTVIYVFYGNSVIATSQANPAGVWDSNYQAVYHLGNLPSTEIASDSTNYANNASFNNFVAEPGQIDGSAGLDGATSFLEIPATAFPSYPTGVYSNIGVNTTWQNTSFDASYSIWFKTNSWGGLLDQTAGDSCVGFFGICLFPSPELPGTNPYGSWGNMLDINFDGYLEGRGVGPSTQIYNDNNWHYATITFDNGVNHLYADGQLIASGSQSTFGFSPNYAYFVGTEDAESDTSSLDSQPWKYLLGQIDEVNVSNTARSGDWIQTQFNNQNSPSTFYKFYSPTAVQVAPSAISLYASQSELFTVPGTCDATITWSLPAGSLGTLTSAGLYMAPSVVSSQQSLTVSATSQSNGSSLGSAQVTLLPAPQPLTLVASSPSPYQVGSVQSFTATLLDPQGIPLVGVTVNFTVAGPNEAVGSATTNASGAASFTYTGATSGTDTVQATASVSGSLLISNSLTAAWLTPPPAEAPTIALLPLPSLGRGALMGAFTDNKGDLIEPIEVGTKASTFITPAGATRLQLGINDTYYAINGGAGFVVAVNGVSVTVPPTAMPWNWQTGGLNNNYQYGVNDGSSPVIAVSSLTAGQPVTIAYQSGTVSTNYPVSAPVNANGDSSSITGTQIYNGAYFPTLYTTGTAYPQNQPVNLFATVVDATGAPIPNTPVTLTVSGANPGQYQAITDATGTASFLYTGQYAGNDSLQTQATLASQGTLNSNLTTIDWTSYPTPPPVGSLSLNYIVSVVNSQSFSVFARDASGNVLPNVNVGCYVTGVQGFQTSSNTNNIGQAGCGIYHTMSGNYSVFAVDSVDRNVIVTQPYTGSWTVPTGSPTATGGTIAIGISGDTTVTMPNALQLTGTVTDNSGLIPTLTWSQVSGPGTVTFATPSQASTTATFSQLGTYVLELFANDTVNSGWAQFTVSVLAPSVTSQAQGWIGTPAYGSAVNGVVPITVAPGVTLASGTLTYAPANNPSSTTVLNANVSGSGQIGSLDTTMLANGPYLIQMQGTDTSGNSQYSLILVTVTGNNKPGRVTTTITDLVVPATGLAINIQRTYDSLNAGTSGDFGYGWNLGISTNLTVDPSGNVTFTIGGQRKTFNLTPTYGSWLFPWYFVAFTPQRGAFGTLTDSGEGCPLDFVTPDGSLWDCYAGGGQYTPSGYIYTDPNGTQYTMSAGGQLQSIVDRSGNGLTIGPNGITSTTGLNVPFVRDSQNRITQITDPAGNVYLYQYDTNGNLESVTYPNTPQPSTYTYDQNHFYLSGTDFRGYALPSTSYYPAGEMDASGNYSVAGKLQSVTDAMGNTTSYTYNLATNTTVVTYPPDANGNIGTATMVYDANGDVLSSTDPLGHTTTNTYNANFNLLSTTDPLGHTTSYTYDANGNKTSTTYPATATSTNTTSYTNYNQFSEPASTVDEDGNTRTFTYDANYNPATVTDSVGTLMSTQFNANGQMLSGAIGYDITQNPARASQFAYDANGNLTSKTDALDRTTSYTYNALGQKITMTEPVPTGSTVAAATTTYAYDAFGNLTQTQAPLARTTSSTYDANGNKISDTDARGNTTNYKYDALNRLVETDYPSNATTPATKSTKSYDFRNNVIDETDQAGNVTHHVYDKAGRLTSVTRGYGSATPSATSYTYYDNGLKETETDSLGHTTTYVYDADSRLTSVSGVAGNTSYGYDDAGNQTSRTDGNGYTTSFKYDARKRLIETDYPDGTSVKNSYDGPGNLASVIDQAGNEVDYTYDAANQLKTVVQKNHPNPSHNTNSYSYDGLGNLAGLTDENSHTTVNSFDVLDEPVTKTLPDQTLTETRQYDAAGNLISLTHFNNVTTSYTYDALNRLLSRSTPGEAPVSFTYTPTGKYLTSTAGDGTVNYQYDSLDRLTTKATPEGTLSYTYFPTGKVETITSANANGISVAYSYDDLNRLETVTDSRLSGNQATTYSYDNASNVATVRIPNGLTSTFTYDQLSRLTELSTPPVADYRYTLGLTGNRTGATEGNGRTIQWSYDNIYRLTGETISGDPANNDGDNGTASYTLDPVGNRTGATSTFSGISPGFGSYNADDEVSNESYDANGNTTRTANGNNYTYDSENHMLSMTSGSTVVTMIYDAFGNRVAKTVNGVTTQYLVEDDVNPTGLPQVLEEVQNGAAVRTYTYGLQRISENLSPAVTGNSTWTPSFYGYDGGGSVRQLTNSAGVVTDEYEYDAYGNSFTKSGTTPNNYLYRGEQYDSDLGLYYLRARYYNPATGRFMSRDPEAGIPTDPKSLHKYLYAGGDPVNLKDPTGRDWEGFVILAEDIATVWAMHKVRQAICTAIVGAAAALLAALHPTVVTAVAAGGGGALGGLMCSWL